MRILFVGDVVGNIGLKSLAQYLPQLKSDFKPQLTIVNGENVNGGKGIKEADYKQIVSSGADIVTGGNHSWDKREVIDFIDGENNMIRPANFPGDVPGKGYLTKNVNGKTVTVLNLQGTAMMAPLDNPFYYFDEFYQNTFDGDYLFVDFHAETTSEKIAFARYVDGRANVVVGTHTHVQTNDAQKLTKGTLYLTDVGMTGSFDGILGTKPQRVIDRFLTQRPQKFDVDEEGRMQLGYAEIILDEGTDKIQADVISPDNKMDFN